MFLLDNLSQILEDSPLAQPCPSLVHPSARRITKQELLQEIHEAVQPSVGNGTVAARSSSTTVGNGTVTAIGGNAGSRSTTVVNRRLNLENETNVDNGDKHESQSGTDNNTHKQWNNLFSGSQLAAKGMSLQFVAPVVKEGKAVAQLQESDIVALSEKWATSVILYVLGQTPFIASEVY